MPIMADAAYDALLNLIKNNGSRLDICSSEPANYTEATSTYTLGNKTSIAYTGPADRSPNGRKIAVNAISGGAVTGTNTAAYWAITDAAAVLYAASSLSVGQVVTNGNTFSLTAFDLGVPDAA